MVFLIDVKIRGNPRLKVCAQSFILLDFDEFFDFFKVYFQFKAER